MSSTKDYNEYFDILHASPYYLANEEAFAGFDAYFQGQWTGALINTRRGKPRTKVQWNCTDAVKEDGLKTTSALEGWHNNLYRRMGRERPKFGRFFAAIQEEETRAKVVMAIAEAALPPTKRPKVVRYQERLKAVVTRGYTKKSLQRYVERLAFLLNRFPQPN